MVCKDIKVVDVKAFTKHLRKVQWLKDFDPIPIEVFMDTLTLLNG
jgi:hypothetical protein